MKIAIVTLGRIGDMILTTPAFSAIKRKFPSAELYVIAGTSNCGVLAGNPHVNAVIPFDKSPLGLLRMLYFLAKHHFDYWIAPKDHKSRESQLLAKFARADVKIGFNFENHNAFTHTIPSDNENVALRFTERVFNSLAFLDIPLPKSLRPELYLSDTAQVKARNFYSALPAKHNLLLNLSASSSIRIYSAENWEAVLSSLDADKFNIILTFMPSEVKIADYLIAKFPQIVIGKTHSLEDYFALIKFCDCLITPDTSAVHVASAFEKNTVALFTDSERNTNSFRPTNPNAVMLVAKGSSDINPIPPENISAKVNEMLA